MPDDEQIKQMMDQFITPGPHKSIPWDDPNADPLADMERAMRTAEEAYAAMVARRYGPVVHCVGGVGATMLGTAVSVYPDDSVLAVYARVVEFALKNDHHLQGVNYNLSYGDVLGVYFETMVEPGRILWHLVTYATPAPDPAVSHPAGSGVEVSASADVDVDVEEQHESDDDDRDSDHDE